MKKIYQYKWLPFATGLAALAVILTQWQAVRRLERIHDDLDALTKIGHSLSSVALTGGVLLSLFLTLAIYFAQKAGFRQEETEAARHDMEMGRARFRNLVETTSDWIWEVDENAVYTYASPKIADMLGYEPEEVIGKTPFDLMTQDEAKRVASIFGPIAAERIPFARLENINLHRDGRLIVLQTSGTPIIDKDGIFRGYRGIDRDITESKNLEEQLRQSQKMEAVGQLAGGIAHDFNNILSTIMGYSEFLLMKMKEGDPLRKGVMEIASAGEKGAELVRNILVFSRKEEANYIPQDLNDIIVTVKDTLLFLIGEDIEVTVNLINNKLMVLADTIQMEQVLLNLATNARDAMPGGGTITVGTELVRLDEDFLKPFDLCKPGEYALITVTDSGTGMDEKTREKVFEPFFTTKDVGEGTGLGLSMVYGIIKRHNGCIDLCSEAGAGTTVKIYLPIVEAACGPS